MEIWSEHRRSSPAHSSLLQIDSAPIATLELRYETAPTLLLCNILKPELPAHQAILNMFPGVDLFKS